MEAEILAAFVTFIVAAAGALTLAAKSLGKVSDSAASMATTVKTLSDELQEVSQDRHRWNEERAVLTVQMAEFKDKMGANQQTIDDLERKLARMSGELDQAKIEIDTLKTERESQRTTIIALESEIGRLQYELMQTAKAKEEAESRLKKEQIETRAEIESLRSEMEVMRNGIDTPCDQPDPPAGETHDSPTAP